MIPYGCQSIDEDDIAAVADVLRGDFLTGGPAVDRFEAALAAAVDTPHAVACANGTAALHLAMMALGIGPGATVVVPSLTFLASANAARYVGAEVRFADVDPETGLLTPDTLEVALQRGGAASVHAVVVVHLNGRCADLDGISKVTQRYGLKLVEDACHAVGGAGQVAGRRAMVGSCPASDLACFSFHPVKTIAMGEGGAVTTRSQEIADRVRRMRNHGMTRDPETFLDREEGFAPDGSPNPWYYEMHEPGFNYRATDIHCALGESQLRKLPVFLARRRALAARYNRLLAGLAPAVVPVPRLAEDDGWHLYAVLIDFAGLGHSRADVMRGLRERGIGTQVHYFPVHRQPYYRRRYGALDLPGADAYYRCQLSLPLHMRMAEEDVDRVVAALADVLGLAGEVPSSRAGAA
ncbi:MAG: UDP-4-amino-4,6-dideoxy-N-acetyl-beta-L-altrosamine transaminase [Rhodospirillaceae bacterium]|nr:UDP-4-amino-4,6-dideoxy-N-acetyl-beta-L-altrosamine transaminase [Rhodospirillaceae bacterium]